MKAAVTAFVIALAGFVFCAIASSFSWHPAVTRPLTVVFVIAATGCAVWLNKSAGGDDGEDEDEEEAQ